MIWSKLFYFKGSRILWNATHRRQLSSLPSYYNDFQNYLPKIVEKYLNNNEYIDSMEIKQRISKICAYHTLARDPVHGKLALWAFHWLAKPDDLTEHNIHQIKVLAWAIELVQSYFIIGDDVEDKSVTRCGQICWHLLPNVGSLAIHDASLLRSIIYEILRYNIDDKLLLNVAHHFNEAYLTIDLAQHLDITISQSKDINKFTMGHYEKCANLKFTYYTIKFPIIVALILCNKASKESLQIIDNVFRDLAILSQMENDLMDYIGYKSLSGKVSSDIQKKKCSWPAMAVLQHGNESQRRVFESCYGRWETESVERILEVYKELDLPNLYRQEERKRYQAVEEKINDLPAEAIPSRDFCRQVLEFVRQHVTDIKSLGC